MRRHEPAGPDTFLSDERPNGRAQPDRQLTSGEAMLQLQHTAGNQAVVSWMDPGRVRPKAPLAVQRGVLHSLSKGWDMYSRLTDIGAPFARELMRWRLTGLGQPFVKRGSADSDWNDFMLARPEIQVALQPVLKQIAADEAKAGPTGNRWLGGYRAISKDITGVALEELESMRLTLHGCHRIEIRGSVHVESSGDDTIVRLYPKMTWIDVAELHPGTTTELDSGAEVDDQEFTGAGWNYPVWIMFEPTGSLFGPDASSQWRSAAGASPTHEAGWPPDGGVPQGGRRG